jgi:hypothetical protein
LAKDFAKPGRIAPRDRESVSLYFSSLRGAKATKQSILTLYGEMDCFAEPVIGRRFAPTRWLAMTSHFHRMSGRHTRESGYPVRRGLAI